MVSLCTPWVPLGAVPACARDVSPKVLRAAVQVQVPASVRELGEMVGIDSGSSDSAGLKVMATYLEARLAALGAKVERRPVPPAAGDMLVATLHGSGSAKFLLLAHMDTVYQPGAAAKWPFVVKGDQATGPGVSDDKGGIAVVLGTLAMLRQLRFADYGTITVAFNPDEEIGSPGSRTLIQDLGSQHDYVLSCEPGGKERILATSGIATLTMTVEGKPAHAGVAPQDGRNALVAAADVIARTRDWSEPDKGFKFNWTIARSGEKHNIVPDHAEATADIRYVREADVTALMARIQELAAVPTVAETKIGFTVNRNRPPMVPTDKARAIAVVAAQAATEFGYPVIIRDTPFGGGSDAAYAAASGKPGVVESFGIGGNHGHTFGEETADLGSLASSIYIMARTIMRLSDA
nr:hypothetical protein TQ38_28800 [Novosphingobium sp. P6W]